MTTSIKVNGKEVANAYARFLYLLLGLGIFGIGLLIAAVILGVGISFILPILIPLMLLTVPLHFLLRWYGRRGFFFRDGNKFTWTTTGALDRRR